ncbi:hypothetical protein [Dryocola clanedunensis]|uniref:hypothetical protein n=1 Tax=Cedecea sulfonylureivorans TaxID=3051154 RepID=UPI001928EACF|nr:hypothetical protein [Cedecea sulfonylureivorans]
MKLQLIGKGNLPLLTFILDGGTDDSILNVSAISRRLGCSRSSLIDRIRNYGFESAIKHFLTEKRKRKQKM